MAVQIEPVTGPVVEWEPQVEQAALHLRGVVKVFEPDGGTPWSWLRSRNGAGGAVVAVDHVDLDIARGEIFGVLGANGSGKSTLIRVISTLLIADAGEVVVFGHDAVAEEMAVKRMLNRVSVEAAFFKKLSPVENLLYAARLYGLPGGEARGRIREILRQLGIAESRHDAPLEKMSRGMQQKVAIARALLTTPMLLLLDEPTTGLDPRSKREVQEFVEGVRRRDGVTVLLTTHDMEEAERMCDRIAILDRGRIIAQDTPAGLKRLVAGSEAVTLEDVFLELTGRHIEEE
jgi:ABC-2 type transport system ATP-binding protein